MKFKKYNLPVIRVAEHAIDRHNHKSWAVFSFIKSPLFNGSVVNGKPIFSPMRGECVIKPIITPGRVRFGYYWGWQAANNVKNFMINLQKV